ncbi:MAG: hypothetical protein HQ521_04960 [Bacteroidetes bacterium]|nr:hypothetical protein [Bacteroidota bacterium]
MKKHLHILFLFLMCACSNSQENNLSNNITKKQTDLILKNAKDFPNKTKLSFGIIKNGAINYFGIKLDNDTILNTNKKLELYMSNHLELTNNSGESYEYSILGFGILAYVL